MKQLDDIIQEELEVFMVTYDGEGKVLLEDKEFLSKSIACLCKNVAYRFAKEVVDFISKENEKR